MLPRRVGARSGLRGGFFGLLTVLSVLAVSSGTLARSHHQHATSEAKSSDVKSSEPKSKESVSDEPHYSDIVVDGNTGAVLHASEPDALRHPASLTKIMTLYLLFEQLEAGKLKLDSWLEVSEHAAVQSPTKLGLRDGQTIKVEDAIKGIVTRSANDAAVVVAEAIAGDEETFARLMTRKAQALGMVHTVYRNASGLPADQQVTTARDQALLGRAVQERFPRYYKYFSTRSFEFRGEEIGNHNRLLGSVEGVDGIKTGYIAASGFNIVTSVHRDNRYLLAVVFGGSSAGSRDQRVRELIHDHIAQASVQRTAPSLIAEAEGKPSGKPANSLVAAGVAGAPKPDSKPDLRSPAKPETKSAPYALASAGSVPFTLSASKSEPKAEAKAAPPMASANTVAVTLTSKSDPSATTTVQVPRWASSAPAARAAPAIGSEDPIHPVPVRTVLVRPGAQTASSASLQPATEAPPATATTAAAAPASASAAIAKPLPFPPPGTRPGALSGLPLGVATIAGAAPADPAPAPATTAPAHAAAPTTHVGWMIQVGAFPAEEEAKQRLSSVQSRAARYLASADAFTESVTKGDSILYRARFAGLGKEQAEAACNYLKRNDVDCMTIRN
jgi:D-alanyl-D-alanine carboxypeptidase